jgi:hypothetical protein
LGGGLSEGGRDGGRARKEGKRKKEGRKKRKDGEKKTNPRIKSKQLVYPVRSSDQHCS